MTLFAILAQTLRMLFLYCPDSVEESADPLCLFTTVLTILISLLSSTFAAVQANADTEIVYQMALRAFESFLDPDPLKELQLKGFPRRHDRTRQSRSAHMLRPTAQHPRARHPAPVPLLLVAAHAAQSPGLPRADPELAHPALPGLAHSRDLSEKVDLVPRCATHKPPLGQDSEDGARRSCADAGRVRRAGREGGL